MNRPPESAKLLRPGEGKAPKPLADFLADREADAVLLQPDEEVEALEGRLPGISLIALNFPAFNDGRAYSSANILRRKYGYQGELRAVGDVRLDQLEQMVRCGFNAFELAEGQDAAQAQQRLAGFSHNYQHTADRPPLFRHRTP